MIPYEGHEHTPPEVLDAVLGPASCESCEILMVSGSHGDDEPSPLDELVHKIRGDIRRPGSDQDGVVGSRIFPPGGSVGKVYDHAVVPEFLDDGAGPPHEAADPFYRYHPIGYFGQYGRLVARASPYFQHLFCSLELKGFCHQGYNIRLRYGLADTDGQWKVPVGPVAKGFFDKEMTWNDG